MIAAPAGLIIWLMANIHIGSQSLLAHGAALLQPLGHLIGLDGYILMAFILGLPANEIVLPILMMSYMAEGAMLELDSLRDRQSIHRKWLDRADALNVMLFSLLHFPCGTTLWTLRKDQEASDGLYLAPSCLHALPSLSASLQPKFIDCSYKMKIRE